MTNIYVRMYIYVYATGNKMCFFIIDIFPSFVIGCLCFSLFFTYPGTTICTYSFEQHLFNLHSFDINVKSSCIYK